MKHFGVLQYCIVILGILGDSSQSSQQEDLLSPPIVVFLRWIRYLQYVGTHLVTVGLREGRINNNNCQLPHTVSNAVIRPNPEHVEPERISSTIAWFRLQLATAKRSR